MRGRESRTVFLVSVLLAMTGLTSGGVSPLSAEPARSRRWTRVHISDALAAGAVRSALDGASRRLEDPRCEAVLAEPRFHDAAGRPLRRELERLAVSADQYLAYIVFVDGAEAACERDQRLAFTMAGSRVVHVCGHRFVRTWQSRRVYAEAVILHEALHTLGLGENPPSSEAITRAVLRHCER